MRAALLHLCLGPKVGRMQFGDSFAGLSLVHTGRFDATNLLTSSTSPRSRTASLRRTAGCDPRRIRMSSLCGRMLPLRQLALSPRPLRRCRWICTGSFSWPPLAHEREGFAKTVCSCVEHGMQFGSQLREMRSANFLAKGSIVMSAAEVGPGDTPVRFVCRHYV